MLRVLTLLTILLFPVLTFAQAVSNTTASGKAAPPTTIHVTSRIVYMDVVVRDSYGRIVQGLSERDFRVFEDGKPQTIDFFRDHTHDALPAAAPEAKHDNALNFSNVAASSQVTNSVNIILFDFQDTAPQDQLYARKQMIRFLENLPPGRQTALFVLGTHLRMLQSFTGTTDRLLAAAKAMNLEHSTVETVGEQQQDSDMAAAFAAAIGRSASPHNGMADMYELGAAQDAKHSYDITRTALQQLAAATSGYPGRKNLYWLADNFSVYDGSVLDINDLSREMASTINYPPGIEDTTDRVADAQIAIYPISLMGLDASGEGPESRGSTSTQQLFTARAHMHELLNNIADNTGGQAYYGTNDFGGALQRGFEDGANYYSLAYRPENKNWNGQFRKIHIKLASSGYTLAYRRGYFALPERTKAFTNTQELNAALQLDTPESTMLLLHSKLQLPNAQHTNVRVDSVIDPANVDFATDAQGRHHAHLLVSLIAISETQAVNATDRNKQPASPPQTSGAYIVDLDQPAFEKLFSSGMPMHQELALAPGRYRLRLGVSDLGNHRIGTLDMPIEIATATVAKQ